MARLIGGPVDGQHADSKTDIIKIVEKPTILISTVTRFGDKVSRLQKKRRWGEYHRDPAVPDTFQWMGWTGGEI